MEGSIEKAMNTLAPNKYLKTPDPVVIVVIVVPDHVVIVVIVVISSPQNAFRYQ